MKLIAIAGLALVAIAVAVAVALSSGGTADEADDPRSGDPRGPAKVEPDAIVEVPQAYFREPVSVTGRVEAVGDERRFALRAAGASVLVQAEPGVRAVERGERVEVLGVVNRVGRAQATGMGDVGSAPVGVGAPFVSADSIRRP